MQGNTFAIFLGASEFPETRFQASTAFSSSKKRFHEYVTTRLAIDKDANCLDLFDSDKSPDGQDRDLQAFLYKVNQKRKEGEPVTLIVYYVGHGAFADKDYFLAIKNTRSTNPLVSSLLVRGLVQVLKQYGAWLKTYLVLDACFSAEAARTFMGAPVEGVKRQLDVLYPAYGLTLLCSSSSDSVSYILPDDSATAFTDGLVVALEKGSPLPVERLTLRQLAPLTYQCMLDRQEELKRNKKLIRKAKLKQRSKSSVGALRVIDYTPDRPQVHTPDQRQGDLAEEPFFPNPMWRAAARGGSGTVIMQPQEGAAKASSVIVTDPLDEPPPKAEIPIESSPRPAPTPNLADADLIEPPHPEPAVVDTDERKTTFAPASMAHKIKHAREKKAEAESSQAFKWLEAEVSRLSGEESKAAESYRHAQHMFDHEKAAVLERQSELASARRQAVSELLHGRLESFIHGRFGKSSYTKADFVKAIGEHGDKAVAQRKSERRWAGLQGRLWGLLRFAGCLAVAFVACLFLWSYCQWFALDFAQGQGHIGNSEILSRVDATFCVAFYAVPGVLCGWGIIFALHDRYSSVDEVGSIFLLSFVGACLSFGAAGWLLYSWAWRAIVFNEYGADWVSLLLILLELLVLAFVPFLLLCWIAVEFVLLYRVMLGLPIPKDF